MKSEGRKALLFLAFVVVVSLLLGLFGVRLLGFAGGPDVQIVAQLKETEGGELELPLPAGGTLVLDEHFYERILVDADLEARRADVVATLDGQGKVGPVKVSTLGYERIPFVYADGQWRPEQGLAPRLVRALSLLEARRQALQDADFAALSKLSRSDEAALRTDPDLQRLSALQKRDVQAEAWYLRGERDEILVSEDFRIRGQTPDRPVDERGTRRLVVREQEGEFFFAAGLM